MIQFDASKMSKIVISTVFGHGGIGMFPFLLHPEYVKLIAIARKTNTAVFAKTSTTSRRKGNWRLFYPWTWKYIQTLESGSLLNSFAHTNLGASFNSRMINLAHSLGLSVIPNYYPDFADKDAGRAIQDTLWAMKVYSGKLKGNFWAVELVASCPNRSETDDVTINIKNIANTILAIRRHSPHLVIGVKSTINHPAEALQEWKNAGADFFHCINALPYNVLFPNRRSPLHQVGGGAISGKLTTRIALEHNTKMRQAINSHMIFGCGVTDEDDVKRCFDAGANAVSICTLIRFDSRLAIKLLEKYNV